MNNVGRLNKRITIGIATDGINPETGRYQGEGFRPIRTVWASVKHVKGSEYFQAAAVQAEKTVSFTIRYQRGIEITEEHQVLYNGKMYDIKAVNDVDEEHDVIVLTCEEVKKNADIRI